jgi:hypothetical protein
MRIAAVWHSNSDFDFLLKGIESTAADTFTPSVGCVTVGV